MKMQLIKLVGLIFSLVTLVKSAKILAIFPFPGPSQYIVAKPLLKALAERGHELTVLNHYPEKQEVANYREIKLEYENYFEEILNKAIKLGKSPKIKDLAFQFYKNISIFTLENREVQSLLYSQDENFDVVIAEALLTEVLYAIAAHFKAHLIGLSSYGTDPIIDSLVGNPSPISYLPFCLSGLPDRMNFWQRLENLKLIAAEWMRAQFHHLPEQEKLYKKYFPHLKMSLQEIYKNFSLVLVNQHFSLSFPRPNVPAMIEVGGMHISRKPEPLPKDVADFIDGAENGVIYFSMGSNVMSKNFSQEKIQILLKVFGSCKQRVLWKFELTTLPGMPENILIKKWFPQSDILAHPNVKLFITHCGLLSTIEAIHHAKPVVGIPVFFDQFSNMEHIKKSGFGRGINYDTFNETDLMATIQEVLEDPVYQKTAQEISTRYHDQPMKPLEKAIYWIEYVLRYNGAPHMRVTAQDLNFIEYHSLDTLGYIVVVWGLLPLVLVVIILKFLIAGLKKVFKRNIKSKNE